MTLTIIIPSYNQGRFIRRTLDSILGQAGYAAQIIVSDGGSTDETVEVLKSYGDRIMWWSERDEGFADAVNKTIPHITGEVVAIQSSDDYYLPGAFAVVEKAFLETGATVVSGSDVSIDLDHQIKWVERQHGVVKPFRLARHGLPQHATFIKTEAFLKLGGVRCEVDMCSDFDLWYRAWHLYPIHAFRDIIAVLQLHPDQRTVTGKTWRESLIASIEYAESTPPFRGKISLSVREKAELLDRWEVFWARNTGDIQASEYAFAKLGRMRGYSYETRAMIASTALMHRPFGFRKLIAYLKGGEIGPFIWKRFEVMRAAWEVRRVAKQIDVRWTEHDA